MGKRNLATSIVMSGDKANGNALTDLFSNIAPMFKRPAPKQVSIGKRNMYSHIVENSPKPTPKAAPAVTPATTPAPTPTPTAPAQASMPVATSAPAPAPKKGFNPYVAGAAGILGGAAGVSLLSGSKEAPQPQYGGYQQ